MIALNSRTDALRRRPEGTRRRWKTVMAAVVILLASAPTFGARRAFASECVWIEFRGVITPLSQAILVRKLQRAKDMGAQTIVLEIDSPGGMVGPSVELAETLAGLTWAHTVAYVPREAISGAAIMALGCHEIIMQPGARIGDAGPIIEGEDAQFREAPEKIVSYLARVVRDLATRTGKSPDLAEAMVNKKLELVRALDGESGKWQILTKQAAEANADRWAEVEPIPESTADKYLTLNGQQAATLGLASHVVNTRDELVKILKLSEPPVELRQTAVDVVILLLNSPLMTALLVFVGLVGLFFELSSPGVGIGGLIAGLCFVLFFWSHFLGGTAGWLEVILFLSGIAFLIVELFVIPGFGIAGICGILLLIASVVMASYEGHFPNNRIALADAGKALAALLTAAGIGGIVLIWLGPRLAHVPYLRRLVLTPPGTTDEEQERLVPQEAMAVVVVGDEGVADTPLRPSGRARFGDEYVDVVADGSFVEPGARVRVIETSGNRIVVREVS